MKKIAVIVIIAALTGGFSYFFIHSRTLQPKPLVKPSPHVDQIIKTKQMQVAEAFFKAYTECLNLPPEEAAGQERSYCFSNTSFTGNDLAANMESQTTPVYCGENPPKSVVAKRSTEINPNQAIVVLTEEYGLETIDVMYQMQRENGEWKVSNIVCPK